MYPLIKSKKYKNIAFSNEVNDVFIKNVEIIFKFFNENYEKLFKRDIIILPSSEHVYPDRFGILFDYFGILTFDPKYTSLVAAYSMFETARREMTHYRMNPNEYGHSIGYELCIFESLGTIPFEYFSYFSEIPHCEELGDIKPTEHQKAEIANYCRKVDKAVIKRSFYDYSIFLMQLLRIITPISINKLLNDENISIRFSERFDAYVDASNNSDLRARAITELEKVLMIRIINKEPLNDFEFMLISQRKRVLPMHIFVDGNIVSIDCEDERINPKYTIDFYNNLA